MQLTIRLDKCESFLLCVNKITYNLDHINYWLKEIILSIDHLKK